MKIHHLNCGTMCPMLGGLVNSERKMVCHCLLIESSDGLVLVDTGIGLHDIRARRLGDITLVARPVFSEEEAALTQVKGLGFSADDVRHIVVTHLDLDHAGGLPDFPKAKVHLMNAEHDVALAQKTRKHRSRYQPAHWAHGPDWHTYEATGEPWFGFESVRDLKGLPPEILMIPVVGHSPGHVAVAVDIGEHWLLHCGDAYFYEGEMNDPPTCTVGLRIFQRAAEDNRRQRLANQDRLRRLRKKEGDRIRLFCAHDPSEYNALR